MIRRSHSRLRSGAAGLAIAALLSAPALSGCDNKTGVAGFVGSTSIETSALSGYVSRGASAAASAQANIGRPEIQQFWLSTLIELQLAQRVAREQNIPTSPTDATVFLSRYAPFNGGPQALQQSAAQIGIAQGDLLTLFQAWSLENAIADRVAPTVLAPDSSARQAYEQLKSSYQGETYEQLATQLRQLLVFDQRRAAVLPVLQDEARRVGVRINPRFGTWNLDRLSIGSPPTDLARPATPSPTPSDPGTAGSGSDDGTSTGTGTGPDDGTGTGNTGGTGDSVPTPAPAP